MHHHRLGKGTPIHHHKLDGVVEHGGVRTIGVDYGKYLRKVVAKHLRGKVTLAGSHPILVSLDGVDFAIMDDQAIGMRPPPRRKGVGAKARVNQRQRAFHSLIV